MKKLLYQDSTIRVESDEDAVTLKQKLSSITLHRHEILSISTRGPASGLTPIADTVDIHRHSTRTISIVITTPDGDADRLMQAIEDFRSLHQDDAGAI